MRASTNVIYSLIDNERRLLLSFQSKNLINHKVHSAILYIFAYYNHIFLLEVLYKYFILYKGIETRYRCSFLLLYLVN